MMDTERANSSEDVTATDEMAGSEHEQKTTSFRLAGFWIRLLAYGFDLVVVSAISFLLFQPLTRLLLTPTDVDASQVFSWLGVSMVTIGLFGLIYFAMMTRFGGQTLGKMIFGIRVIRKDGKALDWVTIIFREGIGRFLSQLFGLHLGYVWCIFHPQKQTWHDLTGETFVVYEEDVVEKQRVHIPASNQ